MVWLTDAAGLGALGVVICWASTSSNGNSIERHANKQNLTVVDLIMMTMVR